MAKSIADKIDFGSILLGVKSSDIESLQSVLATNAFEEPNLKLSIYKNSSENPNYFNFVYSFAIFAPTKALL